MSRTHRPEPSESKTASALKINSAYLAWISTDSYLTIAAFVSEVKKYGVCKRLPTAAIGRALLRPKTPVFVAHDEGEVADCPSCAGVVECPTCRRSRSRAERWLRDITRIREAFRGDWELEASPGQKRSIRVREAHIEKLEAERRGCPLCRGRGRYKASTGGWVKLADGRKIDYRTYTYWIHQPHKFDAEQSVLEKQMCERCAGTGHQPIGLAFGFFIADEVEYVMRSDESLDEASARHPGFVIVSPRAEEPLRRSGKREPGFYAATYPDSDGAPATRVLAELVRRKVVTRAEVYGSFVHFKRPIPIDSKRFRGVAKISIAELARK